MPCVRLLLQLLAVAVAAVVVPLPLRHPPPSWPLPSPTFSLSPLPLLPSLTHVAVTRSRHPRPLRCHRHRPCHPLLHPCCCRSPNTLVPVAIALAVLTLFAAALICRALSLIVVARPHLRLPLQVDCCLFPPLVVGGGSGGIICPSYSADSANSSRRQRPKQTRTSDPEITYGIPRN